MNLLKIGKYLKSIREEKGISYEDVYEKTRIQISILKDIEEGKSLLAPVFLRGFVKNYAKFLEADIKEHLDGKPVEQTQKEVFFQEKKTFNFKKITKKQIAIFFLFIVFLIILFGRGTFQVTQTDESKSDGEFFQQENLEKTNVKENETKKQNLLNKKDLQKISEEKPLTKEVSRDSLLEKIKDAYFRQEILIKSHEKLEIYFKVDNQKLETRNLSPKRWYNIKAVDTIYLRFDRAEGVQVFHNGKSVIFKNQFFEKSFSSDTM